jgi:hypothetical protein
MGAGELRPNIVVGGGKTAVLAAAIAWLRLAGNV